MGALTVPPSKRFLPWRPMCWIADDCYMPYLGGEYAYPLALFTRPDLIRIITETTLVIDHMRIMR